MEEIVIVGNSAAAISALRTIRKYDHQSGVTVITRENVPAYSPVALTYYLADEISREDTFLVEESFYSRHRATLLKKSRVERIDPEEKTVHVEGGTRVKYHRLLIATGARARVDREKVMTLRTLFDADKIKMRAETSSSAVVLGGGILSLQLATALHKRNLKVTLLVQSPQLLSRNVDPETAELIKDHLEENGVSVRLNRSMENLEEVEGRYKVITGRKERLEADLVLSGRGVEPNIDLVDGTAVKVNRGILVDAHMRTSLENVWAAGDVAEARNMQTGEYEVVPTWVNAVNQGRVAAQNLLGGEAVYEGSFTGNITNILGWCLTCVGLTNSDGEGGVKTVVKRGRDRELSKYFFEGNKLKGFILLNKFRNIGVLSSHALEKELPEEFKCSLH